MIRTRFSTTITGNILKTNHTSMKLKRILTIQISITTLSIVRISIIPKSILLIPAISMIQISAMLLKTTMIKSIPMISMTMTPPTLTTTQLMMTMTTRIRILFPRIWSIFLLRSSISMANRVIMNYIREVVVFTRLRG